MYYDWITLYPFRFAGVSRILLLVSLYVNSRFYEKGRIYAHRSHEFHDSVLHC
jgi:hypothetical protein